MGRWRFRIPLAAAATLGIVCLGLGLLYADLRTELRDSVLPRANSLVEDIYPSDNPVRGEMPKVFEIAADTGEIVLILHLGDRSPESRREVRLFDDSGHEVWSHRDLSIGPDQTATLSLPRRFLHSGTYRLRVDGAAGTEPSEFLLEVRQLHR
jgi:hypothetical protein